MWDKLWNKLHHFSQIRLYTTIRDNPHSVFIGIKKFVSDPYCFFKLYKERKLSVIMKYFEEKLAQRFTFWARWINPNFLIEQCLIKYNESMIYIKSLLYYYFLVIWMPKCYLLNSPLKIFSLVFVFMSNFKVVECS